MERIDRVAKHFEIRIAVAGLRLQTGKETFLAPAPADDHFFAGDRLAFFISDLHHDQTALVVRVAQLLP